VADYLSIGIQDDGFGEAGKPGLTIPLLILHQVLRHGIVCRTLTPCAADVLPQLDRPAPWTVHSPSSTLGGPIEVEAAASYYIIERRPDAVGAPVVQAQTGGRL